MKKIKNSFLFLIVMLCISIIIPTIGVSAASEKESEIEPYIIVSLGDSYGSGEGVDPFYDHDLPPSERVKSEDWIAHRSKNSWAGKLTVPYLEYPLYEYKDKYWFFKAISGAKTAEITGIGVYWNDTALRKEYCVYDDSDNLSSLAISRRTKYTGTKNISPEISIFDELEYGSVRYVTISIGGNDAQFVSVLKKAIMGSSYWSFNSVEEFIADFYVNNDEKINAIMDSMVNTYRAIQKAAGPQATILATGYPTLFYEEKTIDVFSLIEQEEAKTINEAVRDFNRRMEERINKCREDEGIDIWYINVADDFKGHEAYSPDPYINPFMLSTNTNGQDIDQSNFISQYSFHPNNEASEIPGGGIEVYRRCVQKMIDTLEETRKQPALPQKTENILSSPATNLLAYAGTEVEIKPGETVNWDIDFDGIIDTLSYSANALSIDFGNEMESLHGVLDFSTGPAIVMCFQNKNHLILCARSAFDSKYEGWITIFWNKPVPSDASFTELKLEDVMGLTSSIGQYEDRWVTVIENETGMYRGIFSFPEEIVQLAKSIASDNGKSDSYPSFPIPYSNLGMCTYIGMVPRDDGLGQDLVINRTCPSSWGYIEEPCQVFAQYEVQETGQAIANRVWIESNPLYMVEESDIDPNKITLITDSTESPNRTYADYMVEGERLEEEALNAAKFYWAQASTPSLVNYEQQMILSPDSILDYEYDILLGSLEDLWFFLDALLPDTAAVDTTKLTLALDAYKAALKLNPSDQTATDAIQRVEAELQWGKPSKAECHDTIRNMHFIATYTYDANGLPTQIYIENTAIPGDGMLISYEYNEDGLETYFTITSTTDDAYYFRKTGYDQAGNITYLFLGIPGDWDDLLVPYTWEYDSTGHITKATIFSYDGTEEYDSLTYVWNGDRLQEVDISGVEQIKCTYSEVNGTILMNTEDYYDDESPSIQTEQAFSALLNADGSLAEIDIIQPIFGDNQRIKYSYHDQPQSIAAINILEDEEWTTEIYYDSYGRREKFKYALEGYEEKYQGTFEYTFDNLGRRISGHLYITDLSEMTISFDYVR